MGHAKEIITIDVYGDKQEIIEDCLEVLELHGFSGFGTGSINCEIFV